MRVVSVYGVVGYGECEDTDQGSRGDQWGDKCAEYVGHSSWCGVNSNDDFESDKMCCYCGGGARPPIMGWKAVLELYVDKPSASDDTNLDDGGAIVTHIEVAVVISSAASALADVYTFAVDTTGTYTGTLNVTEVDIIPRVLSARYCSSLGCGDKLTRRVGVPPVPVKPRVHAPAESLVLIEFADEDNCEHGCGGANVTHYEVQDMWRQAANIDTSTCNGNNEQQSNTTRIVVYRNTTSRTVKLIDNEDNSTTDQNIYLACESDPCAISIIATDALTVHREFRVFRCNSFGCSNRFVSAYLRPPEAPERMVAMVVGEGLISVDIQPPSENNGGKALFFNVSLRPVPTAHGDHPVEFFRVEVATHGVSTHRQLAVPEGMPHALTVAYEVTAVACSTYGCGMMPQNTTTGTPCNPGTFLNTHGVCQACPDGSFSNATNSVFCYAHRNCTRGTKLSQHGSSRSDTTCSECPPGAFSNSSNAVHCKLWTACAFPTSIIVLEGTAFADRQCDRCAVGMYLPTPESTRCESPGSVVLRHGTNYAATTKDFNGSIAAAVANAVPSGTVVNLGVGFFVDPVTACGIQLPRDLRDLTFEGEGTNQSVVGPCYSQRWLTIDEIGLVVTIRNLVIKGCHACGMGLNFWGGGIVYILGGGQLRLEGRVTMQNLQVSSTTEAIVSHGGAIAVRGVNSSLLIAGFGTYVVVSGHTASHGGGVAAAEGGSVRLVDGASLVVSRNTGSVLGGGVWVDGIGSELLVNGTGGTMLVVDDNNADQGGGVNLENGARMVVSDDAVVSMRNNTADPNLNGAGGRGGALLVKGGGTSMVVTGGATRVLLVRNTARLGAGMYSKDRATVEFRSGARVEIKKNSVSEDGAGVYGCSNGFLSVHGVGTELLLVENVAATFGGGVFYKDDFQTSVRAGAVVEILGNVAHNGGGGGVYMQSHVSLAVWGNGTRLRVQNNSAGDGVGGGVIAIYGSQMSVRAGAVVEILGNVAHYAGGVYMQSHVSLAVWGNGTRLRVQNNSAGYIGGGVIIMSGSQMSVRAGAAVEILGNAAQDRAGGVWMQEVGTSLAVSGNGTCLRVQHNSAGGNGGGVYALGESQMSVHAGAVVKILGNVAQIEGGGVYMEHAGTSLAVWGNGTRLRVQHNSAGGNGGGVYALVESQMSVHAGAMVEILGNVAQIEGGGVYMQEAETSLAVWGNGTRLRVQYNSAGGNGGGVYLGALSRLDISHALFANNTAAGFGGALFRPLSDLAECVSVDMYVVAALYISNSGSIQLGEISTSPASELNVGKADDPATVLDKTTSYCLPCGGYEMRAGTYQEPRTWGENASLTLRLTVSGEEIFRMDDQVRTRSDSSKAFSIDCSEQAIQIRDSRFLHNSAGRSGGAISSGRGSYFRIADSTFTGNAALSGNGGAIETDEAAIHAARLTFDANLAPAGNGGAVFAGKQAMISMFDSTATHNSAGLGGGFLAADNTDRLVVVRTSVSNGTAVLRGGGAFAAEGGSVLALSSVNISGCGSSSPSLGGGALSVIDGSEIHLFASVLHDNRAETAGGHAYVLTSSLVLHGLGERLYWPREEPLFPQAILLPEPPLFDASKSSFVHLGENNSFCEANALVSGQHYLVHQPKSVVPLLECFDGCRNTPQCTGVNHTINGTCSLFLNEACATVDSPGYVSRPNSTNVASAYVVTDLEERRRLLQSLPANSMSSGTASSAGAVACTLSQASSAGGRGPQVHPSSDAANKACATPAYTLPDVNGTSPRVCYPPGIHVLSGTTVAHNRATGAKGGGAFSTFQCDLLLHDTTVRNNAAVLGDGGVVHLGPLSNAVVRNGSVLRNNTAFGSGGAIACDECDAIDLREAVQLQDNRAITHDGGALAITAVGPTTSITSRGTTFSHNRAGRSGGAVSTTAEIPYGDGISSTSDIFERNEAAAGDGGALSLFSTKILANGTSCSGNRAPRGGGGCVAWDPSATPDDLRRWEAYAPDMETFTVGIPNTALYGPMTASSPQSLRAACRGVGHTQNAVLSAPAGGGFAHPAPEICLRDFYGNQVSGDLVSSIEVAATIVRDPSTPDTVTFYVGDKIAVSASNGIAAFPSLGLNGPPNTGPYNFTMTAQLSEQTTLTLPQPMNIAIDLCAEGTFLDRTGTACNTCPLNSAWRHSKGPATSSCVCNPGFYREVSGSSMACSRCRELTTTLGAVGADDVSGCVCVRGYYMDSNGDCTQCPDGASCVAGTTVASLSTRAGYWRESSDSDAFYECHVPDDCPGTLSADTTTNTSSTTPRRRLSTHNPDRTNQTDNSSAWDPDGQCRRWHTGPLCAVCIPNAARGANGCEVCEAMVKNGGNSGGFLFLLAAGFLLVFFGIVLLSLTKKASSTKPSDNEAPDDEDSADDSVTNIVRKEATNQAKGRAQDKVDGHVATATGDTTDGEITVELAPTGPSRELYSRLRIMIGYFQIVGALDLTFDVKWPSAFQDVLGMVKFINLDFLQLFAPVSPCQLSAPFLTTAYMHMATLPIAVLLIVVARGVALAARIASARCRRRYTKRDAEQRSISTVLFIVFLLYPGIGTRIFRAFKCTTVGKAQYLVADYSVECWTGEHASAVPVMLVCLVVYVIGIPIASTVVLRCKRSKLFDKNDSTVRDVYGSLYEAYEPQFWYFESIEMIKKMILAGGLVLVAPGSSAQILVGILVTLAYLLLLMKTMPYEDDGDDSLQVLATTQILLCLIAGFALKTDTEGEYEAAAMDIMLVGLQMSALVVGLVATLSMTPCVLGRARASQNALLQHADLLDTVEVFKHLPPEYLKKVVRRMKVKSLKRDATLFAQGGQADTFAVITAGRVRVIIDGGEVCKMKAGQSLGEKALVASGGMRRRGASVICDSASGSVLELHRKDFEKLVDAGIIGSSVIEVVRRQSSAHVERDRQRSLTKVMPVSDADGVGAEQKSTRTAPPPPPLVPAGAEIIAQNANQAWQFDTELQQMHSDMVDSLHEEHEKHDRRLRQEHSRIRRQQVSSYSNTIHACTSSATVVLQSTVLL